MTAGEHHCGYWFLFDISNEGWNNFSVKYVEETIYIVAMLEKHIEVIRR